MSVVIETTLGDITVDLFLKERPNTCLNFLKLCKVKYYNFCVFYKVERNFIAQTGDPTCTGRGGESIFTRIYGDQATYFEAELKPRLKHEKLGTLSMVNNGNNMNGSQFFITLGENLTYLDEDHTVFGEVAEGFETLLKINEAICDPNNRPYQDILITHTVILHDPYDDPSGLEIPDASPLPTKEQLDSNYIRADEEIDDTKGKSAEEIEERIKESEAKARATILEMVGDIPDADVKPPETVLFVCKLNPVTTSEDLEIIFSRFGVIKSCEVIKDKKTGESLQYAFIEFEKEEDCENAYFKMDNVLIDDRRIHVDFSQSVSKMMWEKGSKFPKNKNSRETFVIKNKEKKQDGYQMIFDMDNEITHSKHKEKSKISPDRKYKRKNSPFQRSNERSRRRSRSADKRGEYTYREKEYNSSKSTRDNAHKTSKDYTRSSSSEAYKNTSFSRQKQTKYNSRNRSDSSDESGTKNSKAVTSRYNKPRHDSSSDRSISPPRKQKSSIDKASSSKYTHSSEKYQLHKSQRHESPVSYRKQDKKSVSSRHKSSSPESDVPRNKSKIKAHSRSPEFSSGRTSKPKRALSPKESKSHHRQKKQASRKQSRSPESHNYRYSSKQIKKSHTNDSRSSNSRSPERKKQLYRSRSRSVSPKNYAYDSKLKSSYTSYEKTSKHSKKSKKNKKRAKSSSSSCDSDSSSSSVPKLKHKDNSSYSKTHKSSKEYKQRR